MQPKKKPNQLLNKQLKAEKCPFEMGRALSAACGSLMAASVLLRAQHGLAWPQVLLQQQTLLEGKPSQSWLWQDKDVNLIFLHGVSLQTLQTQASCSWKLTATDERNLSLLF